MFSIEERNHVVVRHRPPGRLMRPSDHSIHGHGLGELDGFLDVLKNFGSGVVKYATAGIYDPSKNRFYVPFSSGQMRNFAQGVVNTHTLGLVKTDKFFNSQTARTVGTIAGGVTAAATAAVGARLATQYFSSPPTQGPLLESGKFVSGGTKVATTAAETAAKSSTASLFTLDNVAKTLDIGSKIMSVGAGGGAVQQQPQYAQGGGAPVVVVAGGGGEVYPTALPGSFQTDPYAGLFAPAMYSPGSGGSMMMAPGGGGIGPPGSEYYVAEDGTVVPVDSATKDIPLWVIIGSGVVLTYVLMSSSKKSRKN